MSSLVSVSGMHFRYGKDRNNTVPWTLTDVSLKLEADSTHGIVGESGSGRSTLIRVLDGLLHHRLSPRLGP